MKAKCRISNVESPSPCFGAPRSPVGPAAGRRHSSFVVRHFQKAFTLIELLTVIAIIGILAALLSPVLKNFSKPNVTVSATRQMLDDVARARQLAISDRTTVFMLFVPTNFWADPQWTALPSVFPKSMVATQLYAAQLSGYMIESLRDVGDQPGRFFPKDLQRVKTLPAGSFIAPLKFYDAPIYPGSLANPAAFPTNRPDLPIYRFLWTNTIPFPTADVMTNSSVPNPFVTVPYIAFNYLGQLTPGDGTVLPYDENIPLDYGSLAVSRNLSDKLAMQGPVSIVESPPGNSTNTAYNVIHIDRITGRARLERQDQL